MSHQALRRDADVCLGGGLVDVEAVHQEIAVLRLAAHLHRHARL